MQGWRLQRACQELALRSHASRCSGPAAPARVPAAPAAWGAPAHVEAELAWEMGRVYFVFWDAASLLDFGAESPRPGAERAPAGLEPVSDMGTVQRAMVQHVGLCDSSRFVT